MTSTKRFRPRFSVRTLVVVVTLVCMYAACWGPTKRRGVDDVASYLVTNYPIPAGSDPELVERRKNLREYIVASASSRVPLIITIDAKWNEGVEGWRCCYYYFWFFGYVVKLPYEREIPHP